MNVSLFGLTIDKSGAVQAIREVTDASTKMAKDGEKSAQLYADAFREKLNRVAREYIPETMKWLDALREKHRQLADAQRAAAYVRTGSANIPGLLSEQEVSDAVRRYDEMIERQRRLNDEIKRGTAEHGPHIVGLSRIGNTLSTMVGHAAGVAPVIERIADAIGIMSFGHLATVGVFAGFAAVAYAYEKLTDKARELKKETDAAVKSILEWRKEQKAGIGGKFALGLELDEARLGTMRQRMDVLQGIINAPVAVGGAGQSDIADLRAAEAAGRIEHAKEEYEKLADAVRAGEADLAEKKRKASADTTAKQISDLAAVVGAHKASAAEIRNAEALLTGLRQSLHALTGDGRENAKRAELIAQINELNEALHPKKEARQEEQLRAEIARVLRESDQERERKGVESAKRADAGLERLTDELQVSQALLDAQRQQTAATREAADEAKAYQMVERAGITLADAQYEAALQAAQQIVANERATKELKEAQTAAQSAVKKSAHETEQILKGSFATFFTELTSRGKNAFQALWDAAKQGFFRMWAEILAAKATDKLMSLFGVNDASASGKQLAAGATMLNAAQLQVQAANTMLQASGGGAPPASGGAPDDATQGRPGMGTYAGVAIGTFAVGYGLGRSMYSDAHGGFGNYARGGLSGAASGALIGAQIAGPVGAAVGAVAGFVGGLMGVSSAAKEARKHMEELQKALALDMAALRATVGHDQLGLAIAQVNADREQKRKQIEDAFPGGGSGSEQVARRNAALNEMNALEEKRIQQLRDEYAAQQRYAQEDLTVRKLRAEGKLYEADALAFAEQQQREYEQAVRDGKDATYLAMLAETQRAEAINRTTNALADAVRNAPSGFKVTGYSYDFATPAGLHPSPAPLTAASRGGMVINLPGASFTIKGGTGKQLLADFVSALRTAASETTGTNVPLSQALDRLN